MLRPLAIVMTLLLPHVSQAQLASSHAERIFINGRLITQDNDQPRAEALAVAGGKIMAVGSNEKVRALAGAAAQIIDLHGRTLIPGLIDSHIHAIRAGLTYKTEVSWIELPDLRTALQRIAATAQRARNDDWIVIAGGWNVQQFREQRRPTLAEIETAAPDRAVYIQLAYNSVLMTPQALRRLEIEGDDDLPAGAHFQLDKQGARTGWIVGKGPAIVALFDRLPKNDIGRHIEGTRRFFRTLNSYGVTGVIDPGGHNIKPPDYAALFELARKNQLTLRVAFSAFAPRAHHEREDLDRLVREYASRHHPLLQFNGIGENITWGFYNNPAPTTEDEIEFERVARWAAQRRLRLTVHWNSGAIAHRLLDVFERIARDEPIRDLRWSIAHLHDGSRETILRMHALGLGWLTQNAAYFAAPAWLRERGKALATTPPLRTALRIGLPTGGGTDAHRVMSFNPFLSLRWMVDGITAGGLVTRGPDELLTRAQALRLYTLGSAWFTGDENRRGMLAPGRDADFAVLDGDFLAAPAHEFAQLRSVLTSLAGRIVYASGPFAELEEKAPPAGATERPR